MTITTKDAAIAYANAWNNLEIDEFLSLLDENVIYTTQLLPNKFKGKSEIKNHLRDKKDEFKSRGIVLYAELGYVSLKKDESISDEFGSIEDNSHAVIFYEISPDIPFRVVVFKIKKNKVIKFSLFREKIFDIKNIIEKPENRYNYYQKIISEVLSYKDYRKIKRNCKRNHILCLATAYEVGSEILNIKKDYELATKYYKLVDRLSDDKIRQIRDYYENKNYKQYIIWYCKSMKKSKDYMKYNDIAYLLIKNKRLINLAEKMLDKAFELAPDNSHVIDTLGLLFMHKNQYEKALNYFKLSIVKGLVFGFDNVVAKEHYQDVMNAIIQKTSNNKIKSLPVTFID